MKVGGDPVVFVFCIVQFKKREKHSWRSVTFSNFTKNNTPPWVFFTLITSHITKADYDYQGIAF